MMLQRFPHLIFLIIISLWLSGCSSIPKQELSSYSSNFNYAKTTTQDIILVIRLITENEEVKTNEDAVFHEQKLKALDARLDALECISSFNDVLVSLASGTDPKAVYGSLSGLSVSLNSFGSSKLNSLVENAMPYGELISQAVTLIDNAIKAEKFKDAADAAHKPVLGIIEILILDSDDLFEIQFQTLSKRSDIERDRIIDSRFNFDGMANSFQNTDDINHLVDEFNSVILQMNVSTDAIPDPVELSGESSVKALTTDMNTMKLLTGEVEKSVNSYNQIKDQLNALAELKLQYKNILEVTSESLINLHHAVMHDQYLLPIDIASDVLNLRKAYLKLQESK